ncbi:proteasome subunit alpha type-7 [Tanacetum coccineum]|uniref:Proteasome subunit alpha type-7 n=1 Tax=Tanacetum coccineum TaxID=301880 RepID=A0ABQ4YG54_9ASTR
MIFTRKLGRNYLFVGVASSSIKMEHLDGTKEHDQSHASTREMIIPFTVCTSVMRSVRKIVNLDDHVALACAGLKANARVLINKARIECQNHKLTIEDPVEYITRYITGLQQKPFGMSTLIPWVQAIRCHRPRQVVTKAPWLF